MHRVPICADLQALSLTHAHTFEKVHVPGQAVKGGGGGWHREGGTGCDWHSRVGKKCCCIQVFLGSFGTLVRDFNMGRGSPTHLWHPVRIFDGDALQTRSPRFVTVFQMD